MALHSNIIDLTISDDESETRSYVPSRKRNGSHLTPSPVPIKKHNSDSPPSILVSSLNGASRSHLPVNSVKEDRILEGNIRKFINHPDGPSQELPKNIFANVLIKPQLHLTPRTATGFGPSNDARPPVELDKEDLKRQVKLNLSLLNGPKVKIVNHIDSSSPPVNFAFINENYVGVGVEKVPAEYMSGCDCKQENGRSIGCEYLRCQCVQQQDPDEETGRRAFPYSAADTDYGCLRDLWLKGRRHIYECNDNCNCEANCKNRVVQHGRQVPLEIFKTVNRGWGLRCPVPLKKGQFIDTYRGEIITNEEDIRRSQSRQPGSDNYMFGLDKFSADVPHTITKKEFLTHYPDKKAWHRELVKNGEYEVTKNVKGEKMWRHPDWKPPKYSIDGMHMGSPTRFINHSCEPNCAIYTVSYNSSDEDIYEIAFFAMEDIPAREELTFDYKGNDDNEVITDEMADEMERIDGERPIKCLCGSEDCRGYFFNH